MAQKNVLLCHLCTSAVNFVSERQTSTFAHGNYCSVLSMVVPQRCSDRYTSFVSPSYMYTQRWYLIKSVLPFSKNHICLNIYGTTPAISIENVQLLLKPPDDHPQTLSPSGPFSKHLSVTLQLRETKTPTFDLKYIN